MSVTGKPDDNIPHGLKGYRLPYNCRCDVCKAANTEYMRGKRAEYAKRDDELSARREARKVTRRTARRTESSDSVAMGAMEKAVIEETDKLERAKDRPTQVVAARNLAKIVDNPKLSSIHTSTTKQIMAIMADLRGDMEEKKRTGRRKSGSRLATVGQLTKVKRAQ
jgi:hypothetical protein